MSRQQAVEPYQPWSPTAWMRRPSCSECAGPIEWMPLGEAWDVLGAETLNGFIEVLGVTPNDDDDWDFWQCKDCGESGVLFDVVVG